MLMAARAKVLMDPRSSFIATLTSPAVTPRTPALEAITFLHYTAAVASQQLREIDHAQASLNAARKLQAQLPGAQATEVSRLLSLAEIELHAGPTKPASPARPERVVPQPKAAATSPPS